MPFIHKDFLLSNKHSRYLYERYAAAEPILDYHCHLPPADVAANRQFDNLFEIWLEGDHYKWRAMRANGIDERYCTGDASPYEKFLAWARTVPMTLRNPLYHWTHLELLRYFDIDEPLDENTAPRIWEWANEQLATNDLRAHGILRKFSVRALCTTDDPADDLAHHKAIAASGIATKVFPTFRPDKAMNVHLPEAFNNGSRAWKRSAIAASATSPHSSTPSNRATTSFTRWAAASPITASTTSSPISLPSRKLPRSSTAPAPVKPPLPPKSTAASART